MNLKPNEKLNIEEILKDLDKYSPKRRGWTWREHVENLNMNEFTYKNHSKPLKNSIPMPAAKYFDNIDPQPDSVITTEIASGRFEDDLRRMRMAAWHGADHIMVIRTMGQSHMDALIEGTPEGIGGVPISRKQLRATRKALDLIEEEVGRAINFHSYVSGVAGPEIAAVFVEEGVNGAHQDPQYNVLYRNINMFRSFTDAAEAKKIMAAGEIFQIDGAHNANATAKKAWKVMPELMVQHAINSAFSVKCGMKKENIGLSTVPPTSTPAPKFSYDFPYAVALRELFSEFKMRAQQNTRYMESDEDEANATHMIDLLISALTSADIQSTITPDEGRNVPWHYNNIRATDLAKQVFNGLDGIKDYLKIDFDGPLYQKVRELKERAILFMEDMIEAGGYFEAVEKGFFVDSGLYPERNGDGIFRYKDKGIAEGTVVKRDEDYFAPVAVHFGYNNVPKEYKNADDAINKDSFSDRSKIVYIDELDQVDNANNRLKEYIEDQKNDLLAPEVEWHADSTVVVKIFIPTDIDHGEYAALEMAKKMNLEDPEIVHKASIHPSEGSLFEIKGKLKVKIDKKSLTIPEKKENLEASFVEKFVKDNSLKVVAGTVGEDEHSVGMQEILDIKHGGIEKYGFEYNYLGTSVPIEKMVDAAIETGACAILISTIISHNDVHRMNMKKLHNICVEKGIRDKVILICGGTQVTNDIAKEEKMDAGFGRGTKGIDVASFIVEKLM
jgi:D-ornithine 4,5-aminomutase subunit beta